MKISNTTIADLKQIDLDVFYDFRGEFLCTFNVDDYSFFDQNQRALQFVEDDVSVSRHGVLRGLHGDDKTWKLIHCVYGDIYCVVADMRKTSVSYLKWEAITLNDHNRRQLLVPAGCAVGIQCMAQTSILNYKQTQTYKGARNQFSVRWDDPALNIFWPIIPPLLSQRDKAAS